jgi:Sulfotransferase family
MVLIIGGHIRSGTLLLRNLCNSHPEMAITNELNFFSSLGETYREHSRRSIKRLWRQTIRNKTRWKWNLHSCNFGSLYLFKLRRYRDHLIDVKAIESTLQSIFPEARIIGDKTPSYVFLLDKLVVINGLRCLIIFRDCRDVTSSVLERVRAKWHRNPWSQTVDTAEKVAKRWVYCIEPMDRHKEKIHIIR